MVCGEVSGNLAIRDFDIEGSYESWVASQPSLASTLPTVRTARGYHVYCRTALPVRIRKYPDGELRGTGGYTLAPPSIHPSDAHYQWKIALEGELPIIEPAVFARPHDSKKLKQREQSQQKPTEPTEANRGHSEKLELQEAIVCTIPNAAGERERKLMELARRIHAIVGRKIEPRDLTPIFDEWWTKAETIVATKDYTLGLASFVRAYQRVKVPYGETMADVLQAAMAATPPSWAIKLRCELLASICRELQHRNTPEPFYLSARKAGELTKESYPTAYRKMELLVAMGHLEVAKRGKPGGQEATRYRCIGDW